MKPLYNIKITRILGTIIFVTSIILCYVYFFHQYADKTTITTVRKGPQKHRNRDYNIPKRIIINERIVHLDLKGAPPKIPYYSKLFPLLTKMGATGVLIEYEDMFPYSGRILSNVSALNAYTSYDIQTINTLAKENHLKVVPLVQTFGHLEFLLKLKKFKNYREVWNFPSSICPSYSQSVILIEEMIDQVIKAHPESDMIHIGCDEVFHLGSCQKCRNKMLNNNLTKTDLFLDYISTIIAIIRKKYPSLKILAWDDHFRVMDYLDIRSSKLGNHFEPVVWQYRKDVYDELGPSLWNMYAKIFPNLWVASTFKGAIGSNKYISDVNHYIQNHKSWITVIKEYGKRINFKGIILTGWQRYDHFAVLCELLPVGIPALAMSLRLLRGYRDSLIGPPLEVAKVLQCAQPYGLIGTAFGSPKCKFPGGDILENIIHLYQLKQEYDEITEDSRVKGWLSEYNIMHSFSNPQYVKSVLMPIDKIKSELEHIKENLFEAMAEVYDRYTINEWVETYIKPFETQIITIWTAKQNLLEKESWPRRPLDFNNEL